MGQRRKGLVMLGKIQQIITDNNSISDFLFPRNKEYEINESYEKGGVALYNPKQGLNTHVWYAWTEFNKKTNDSTIFIKRDDLTDKVAFLTDKNVSEIDLTFDQNMNPCLVYVADNVPKLYFYDTQLGEYTTIILHGIQQPRISLDDKRAFNIPQSNIVLAYMRDKSLYMRLQQDRFGVEYHLKTFDDNKVLHRVGMGKFNRFLFALY